MPPFRLSFIGFALSLACTAAQAAPKDELHGAFVKFLALESFEAVTTDLDKGEQTVTIQFVAPDRYRIHTPEGGTQYIIGDAMYMDMDGQVMRVPVPVGKITAQYRNEAFLREVEADLEVKALPDETVNGEAAKVYAYSMTRPAKAEVKTWISQRSGLPIQVQSSGRYMGVTSNTMLRYTRFNDPAIRIDEP